MTIRNKTRMSISYHKYLTLFWWWPLSLAQKEVSLEKMKINLKRCMHPNVHNNTAHNSQDMERTQCPSTNKWIKKRWCIYIHISTERAVFHIYTYVWYTGIPLCRKNDILPFAVIWMNLENIMLRKISQRITSTVWYHLYVKFKK